MSEQKTFLEKTWSVGEYVTVKGKHGQIKVVDMVKNKVMVEHTDLNDGKPYKRNYLMSELPPYPADETPNNGVNEDPVEGDAPEVLPDEDTTPMPMVEGETEEMNPLPAAADSTPVDETEDAEEKSPPQTPPHGAPDVDIPVREGLQEEAGDPDELWFEEGHTRQTSTGSKLVVGKPTVRGKWLVRVFLAKGGTNEREYTAAQIADWGVPVAKDQQPEVKIGDEIKAAIEQMAAEEAETSKNGVLHDAPVVQPRFEICMEHFVLRDADGFHSKEASDYLQSLVEKGWEPKNAQLASMYIPQYVGGKTGYVETVVYWTLTRVVMPEK